MQTNQFKVRSNRGVMSFTNSNWWLCSCSTTSIMLQIPRCFSKKPAAACLLRGLTLLSRRQSLPTASSITTPISLRTYTKNPEVSPANRTEPHDDRIRKQHLLRVSLEHLIRRLSDRPLPTVSLNDLLKFQSKQNQGNHKTMLIQNANETLRDLFVLVGKRLKKFMDLPYIVMLNPKMAMIYNTYLDTLQALLRFVNENAGISGEDVIVNSYDDISYLDDFKITTLEQNQKFINVLNSIIDMHTDNVTYLSDGFEEVSGMQLVDEKEFLNNHLKERILMRLLSQHHIKLTSQMFEIGEDGNFGKLESIGIIDKNINILELLNRSFGFVNDMSALKYDEKLTLSVKTIIIQPDNSRASQEIKDISKYEDYNPIIFPYITSHIEYVLNEILKNSTRAHAENKVKEPLEALIVVNRPDLTLPDPQFYKLQVRITDKGKGVKPEIIDKLFEYSFTTFDDHSEDDDYKTLNTGGSTNIIAGMGYGLPLSLTYNKLFHGDINLKSIYGEGTSVYLTWVGIDGKKLVE